MEDDVDLGSTQTVPEDCACEEEMIGKDDIEPTPACEITFLRLANLRDAWLIAYNLNRSSLRESDVQ